jgi:hypothetical protein
MTRQSRKAANILWIDTLCVDQANTAEESLQVTQMGQIYAHAAGVYFYFDSASPSLGPVLRFKEDHEAATPQQWSVIQAHQTAFEYYLCGNEYWTRAWILQEIYLARTVTVWADTEVLLFEHLHWSIDYCYLAWRNRPIARFQLSTKCSSDLWQHSSLFP